MADNISCSFTLDKTLIRKFNVALALAEENETEVLSRLMSKYICEKFSEEAKSIMKNSNDEYHIQNDNQGKALFRIPRWASKPNQCNHRILKAFFMVENNGVAEKDKIFELCSDRTLSTYVRDFNNNFSSMSTDSGKSHGKVFEINDDGKVIIWKEIKEVALKYRNHFEGVRT